MLQRVSWAAAVLVSGVAAACSQAPLPARYALSGSVQDSTGAIVPGVTLRLKSAAGKPLGETRSDAGGNFGFSRLPGGDLSLVIAAGAGFAELTQPVHLTQSIAGLKVTLPLAPVSESIDVSDTPPLSTDANANRDTISVSGDQLRKLPVFDQDIIATLTPFLDLGSTASGGVTLIVDGVEMKSVGVSASAIQEVRINNDPYTTESGRPGRGRIEIITKPGSPEFHGEANFIFRDSIFNAKNHFALVRPPEARRIYEGHLSGPVGGGGHTNFIASGSRREQDTAVVVNAVGPLNPIGPTRLAGPIGPIGPINENVLTPNRDNQATLRVTHDFSANHRLQVGYNFEYSTRGNAGVGGLVLPEAGYNTAGREDDAIFNDRVIVTPNLINQLMVIFEKDEDVTASVTDAPAVSANGSFIGGGAQADVNRTENTVHVNEVVSWTHGRHYLRFGAQLPQLSKRAVDDRTNRIGTYKYASLGTYSGNQPYVFTLQQGPGRGLYWINEVGGFVQDQVKLNAKTQLSVGLRYDWQTYVSDNNNFSPRFSLAYAPDRGKTILRVGGGVFYDRTGGDYPATFKLHDGVVLQSFQLQNPPPVILNLGPTSIVREAANLRSPYWVNSSFGVERQVAKGTTLSATYRNQVQVKSFRSRDANAPVLPANPSLGAVYARPDPNFAQIQQIESGGRQLGNALDVAFRGNLGRWFNGQAQYTLARTSNNTGGINWFPQNQYRPNDEWSRASFDRLHSFNLIGNLNPDHLLSLGIAVTLYSGIPYTETTGNDDFHTGLGNARPAGVGRNTLEASGTADLDLIWDHDFRLTRAQGDKAKMLSTGISAFNILNQSNFGGYIGDVSSPLFLRPTAALAGRQIQFSAGYRF